MAHMADLTRLLFARQPNQSKIGGAKSYVGKSPALSGIESLEHDTGVLSHI
jgi:hypothetical protein